MFLSRCKKVNEEAVHVKSLIKQLHKLVSGLENNETEYRNMVLKEIRNKCRAGERAFKRIEAYAEDLVLDEIEREQSDDEEDAPRVIS